MNTAYEHIEAARASTAVYLHHPANVRLSEQARKIDHAKCEWLLDNMWKEGYKAHETVIVKDTKDDNDLLLGGAHRTVSALFLFAPMTCKVVARNCGAEETLTKVVQFTEPISNEWNTLAQCALFAQHITQSETGVSAKILVERFLGGDMDESRKHRHMLFGKQFMSEPSMKRFVRGVRSLVSCGWLEKLEEDEAAGKLKCKTTHILSIGLLSTDDVLQLLQKHSADGSLTGSFNPFYERYRNTKKRAGKRAREVTVPLNKGNEKYQ